MTEAFKTECKNTAYKNRLGKVELGTETISNSDNLSSIEFVDTCITNGSILGNTTSKTIKVKTLNNYELADKEIIPFIGVKYADLSEEYIRLGKYTISSETNATTAKNGEYNGVDISNKLNNEYVCGIEDLSTATIIDFYADVCNQLGLTPKSLDFMNSDILVGGNPFTNGETCRIVLQNIAQVFCTFVDIDWGTDEIDLIWFDDDYAETFTKCDYSSLEQNQVYGPINSVVIKESAIEGENVVREDTESIEANGECQISIEDNYFLSTEELRTQAIDNIYNRLLGFTYVDCKITSYTGKPYLKRGNKISVQSDDGTYFDTYVLTHTFAYDGTFKSIIESPALTKTQTAMKNKQNISTRFRKVERSVDKVNGLITDTITQVTDIQQQTNSNTTAINNNYQELLKKFDGTATTDELEAFEQTMQSQMTANELKIESIQSAVINGVEKVKTTSGTFDENGLTMEQTGAKTKTTLDETGVDVVDTQGSGEDLLFAGYVDEEKASSNEDLAPYEGQTVTYTKNIIVKNYLTIGTHSRIEDYEDGTGVFNIS